MNWLGNQFHLLRLEAKKAGQNPSLCRDDPAFEEELPSAGFDTYRGQGIGVCERTRDARAKWVFTDQGEPGVDDRIVELRITGCPEGVSLSVDDKELTFGNHQAHRA